MSDYFDSVAKSSCHVLSRYIQWPLMVLILLCCTTPGWQLSAQENDPADNQQPTPGEQIEDVDTPNTPDRVEVNPLARDNEIEDRLSEILESTKRFEMPEVNVENGVVFLSGVAKEDEFKTWATDLASKTQDVAAVVNRMSVAEKSIWDFTDAFAELREFRNNAIQAIPVIMFGIVVLILTWFTAKGIGAIANRVLAAKIPNSLLRWVTTRAIMLPILIFGVYLVLRVAGLTQLALTVLGGTGLIGLIVGIAFQDIAENFLASILISIQKPFRIGDLVRVDGHEGIVQRVTTRGTTLLTNDGNHVQIPNSKIYKNTIENFTANPLRRVSFAIGIGYDDSTSQAQSVVLNKIKQHTATLDEPPPRVLIENLGASTVNLTALFWIDGTKNDWRSVRSSCMRIAKQALMQNGISLPDEAREVIFPNGVPVLMGDDHDSSSGSVRGQTTTEQKKQQAVDLQDSTLRSKAMKQQLERDQSEAEGNMATDLEDLKKQGEESWLPGEGEDVLVGEEDNATEPH